MVASCGYEWQLMSWAGRQGGIHNTPIWKSAGNLLYLPVCGAGPVAYWAVITELVRLLSFTEYVPCHLCGRTASYKGKREAATRSSFSFSCSCLRERYAKSADLDYLSESRERERDVPSLL